MPTNHAAFGRDLDAWAQKDLKKHVGQFVQKIVFLTLDGVVSLTPVDTGRARANWQVGVNILPTTELDEQAGQKGVIAHKGLGGSVTLREASAINGIQENDRPYIINNVPYIVALENGHSAQARQGMVELTLARINAFHAKER